MKLKWAVVVGEIPGISTIADDEKLQKAEQGFCVAVAWVILVINDLLHCPARTDGQRFQLNLRHRHAVDEQDYIKAVVAVVSVDAQLIDYLKVVLAPVLDVDQRVIERCVVIAFEAIAFAKVLGCGEDIWRDDRLQQTGEFTIG